MKSVCKTFVFFALKTCTRVSRCAPPPLPPLHFSCSCNKTKQTLLTSVSFRHSGHLMPYFSPSCFTSLSRQRLQYVCRQLNTRGSTNSSIHTGHSKLSNRFSRFSARPVAIVQLCFSVNLSVSTRFSSSDHRKS